MQTDVVGPTKYQSDENVKLFMTPADRYRGYYVVVFIDTNIYADNIVVGILLDIENLFKMNSHDLSFIYKCTVKWLRNDVGGEYI